MMLFLFFALNITCGKSSQKGAAGIFCIRIWLALCCLFSVIVRCTLQHLRNTWDVLGESLKFGKKQSVQGL